VQSLFALSPVYVRGGAYLAAHRGSEAAAEFQKILDHRGIVLSSLIRALAHLQIGRAYSMQGDTAKAKAEYQDFLTLWKDADPDIPILTAAKAEYDPGFDAHTVLAMEMSLTETRLKRRPQSLNSSATPSSVLRAYREWPRWRPPIHFPWSRRAFCPSRLRAARSPTVRITEERIGETRRRLFRGLPNSIASLTYVHGPG
jgi:tetratricopeptide (TPR) repeat protein